MDDAWQPIDSGRTTRDPAATKDRRDVARRAPHDREPDDKRRFGAKPYEVIETGRPDQARACSYLRHARICTRRLDTSGASTVHEFEIAHLTYALDGLAAARRHLSRAKRLHSAREQPHRGDPPVGCSRDL